MLSITEIKKYYPQYLHKYRSFMLREYLQYKILEIVFDSKYANKLCFIGGTCLRIVHNNTRFSEDLDFDNFNLSGADFSEISKIINIELSKQGYEVEIKNIYSGAFHCHIKFPNLLFNEGISGHKEEKILIQLDTESQNFIFEPEQKIINKFDVFTSINTTPQNLLLAQKFYAVINRKRNKGRDFFDIIFMLGQGITPNYKYFKDKINIDSPEELRELVMNKCTQIDMKEMAKDVRPFLFNSKDEKRVLLFASYIEQAKLE